MQRLEHGPLAAGDPHAARRSPTSRSPATACSSARASRWAPISAWPSISGYFAFDALIVFAPQFMFMIDLGIGSDRAGVRASRCAASRSSCTVEGPAPWRAEGTPRSRSCGGRSPVDVGPFTWGDDDNPPPAPADPRQLARDALHHNPGAWQALVPPDADRVVRV